MQGAPKILHRVTNGLECFAESTSQFGIRVRLVVQWGGFGAAITRAAEMRVRNFTSPDEVWRSQESCADQQQRDNKRRSEMRYGTHEKEKFHE